MALTANAVTYTAIGGSSAQAVPVGAQNNGSPVTPDSYAIVTPPSAGAAAVVVSPAGITYAPTDGTLALTDSFTYTVTQGGITSSPAMVSINISATYNCACDDDWPTATLATLQRRILVRLGMAAMPVPPPGMAELVNDFLASSQTQIYEAYPAMRTERWFTWQLQAGQRFYDIAGNLDACSNKLDPLRITWVGISRGDNVWQQLIEGINPIYYTSKVQGIPTFYEVRQCIEVWPATSDTTWLLRIKGNFGLLPFANPNDVTTVNSELVFLHALAVAKAHYGQPDAGNIIQLYNTYLARTMAAQQPTRRMWPGGGPVPNAIPPVMSNNPGTN